MAKTVPHTGAKVQPRQVPILNLNLRTFIVPGLLILLFYPPFLRGLFFAPELLPTQMFTAVIFALWCFDKLIRRDPGLKISRLDLANLAFLAAYLLSLIHAVNMNAAVGEVQKVLAYLLLYLVVADIVREQKDMRLILKTICLAAFGVSIISLGSATRLIDYPGAFSGREIMGTFQYENALAAYLIVNLILGLTLLAAEKSIAWRYVYGLGNYLLWVTIIATLSRGGWLLIPVAMGLLFIGLPAAYRWRTGFNLALTVGVALVVSRWFLPAVTGPAPSAGVLPLGIGLGVALAGHLVYEFLEGRGQKALDSRTGRIIRTTLTAYFILVALVYLIYAAMDLPSNTGLLMPDRVMDRLESIQRNDNSISQRYDYYLCALDIVRDHPLTGAGGGGWNALYHQYQPYLYWTSEVHNHFFQVWVEAGTVGFLAFLTIWYLAGRAVCRYWKRTSDEEDRLLIWGVGVAAVSLGLHSFVDFDLSLPAVSMVLWTLFGLIRAKTEPVTARPGACPVGRYLAFGLGGLLTALILFIPAWCFYQAGQAGAAAARAMLDKDLRTAQSQYQRAYRLNPFNAGYAGDLAQVCTVRGIEETRPRLLVEAKEYAARAVRLEPYNFNLRLALLNVYLLQGEIEESMAQAEAVLNINPMDTNAYELVGRSYVFTARYYLEGGKKERAAACIAAGRQLRDRLENQGRDAPSTRQRHRLVKPPAPPGLALIEGQLEYLAGDYPAAESKLAPLLNQKNLQNEARIWLAAALTRQGRTGDGKMLQLINQDNAAAAEYKRLINLAI